VAKRASRSKDAKRRDPRGLLWEGEGYDSLEDPAEQKGTVAKSGLELGGGEDFSLLPPENPFGPEKSALEKESGGAESLDMTYHHQPKGRDLLGKGRKRLLSLGALYPRERREGAVKGRKNSNQEGEENERILKKTLAPGLGQFPAYCQEKCRPLVGEVSRREENTPMRKGGWASL